MRSYARPRNCGHRCPARHHLEETAERSQPLRQLSCCSKTSRERLDQEGRQAKRRNRRAPEQQRMIKNALKSPRLRGAGSKAAGQSATPKMGGKGGGYLPPFQQIGSTSGCRALEIAV